MDQAFLYGKHSKFFSNENYACQSSASIFPHLPSPRALQSSANIRSLRQLSLPGSDSILNVTSTNLKLTFVGAPLIDAPDDQPTTSPTPDRLPPALHVLNNPEDGLLSREEFFRQIGRSVALVGIGDPPQSPTAYDALVSLDSQVSALIDLYLAAYQSPVPPLPMRS